ncbi:MAG: alpha/beta fold hydrolase [Phenylobacterium sp.]
MSLETMQPTEIRTSLGIIPIWSLPGALTSTKPIVLSITGAWASPRDMEKTPALVGPDWDAATMRLPGNGTPQLAETSIAAWARAAGELIDATFQGRAVVLAGLSVGALVALGVRSSVVRRVVALDPPLVTRKLWPMLATLRQQWRTEPASRRFIKTVFGVSGSAIEDRRYFKLFDGAPRPIDVIVGAVPLYPQRDLARFPSLVDEPERAWLAARPGVTLHVAPGAGHALHVYAGPFVLDRLFEAMAKALAPRNVYPWQFDEALVASTPLTARRVQYVGPRGAAFAAAYGARNPQAEVACREKPGSDEGFDAVAVEGEPSARPSAAAKAAEPLRVQVAAFAWKLMDIRTRLPAAALASEPDLVVRYGQGLPDLADAPRDAPKVLVLQRPAEAAEDAWRLSLAGWINKGWVVVLEFDDHPELVGETTGRPAAWERFGWQHAIQTSTPRLAEAFAAYNPEVRAFPNAVFELLPFPDYARPPRVFYGGVARGPFAVEMARALAPAIEAVPSAQFVVVGDRAVFDALPTQAKAFHDYLPYEDYLELMSTCAVSLSPIQERPLVDTKSDAKFLDAARAGVLTIASPMVYAETIVHGETGLIARGPADWAPLLHRALAEPEWRDAMARRAWAYVRDQRMFAHQVAERKAWYRSLWERREALTRALMDRMPGLETLVDRTGA